ncbi:hypothetical protein [Nonomuraea sp. NPDC003709]|uniref:hypothetical protein n=1 Tax=Nonomuraea sp. NPDC003709 TaxID=3154450 RepID=UPI0033B7E983
MTHELRRYVPPLRSIRAEARRLWVSRLVPLGYLYAANSLVGLTLVSALFCKPSLPAMAAFTVVVVRRAVRQEPYATGAAPDHQVVAATSEGRPAPRRKDPS